LFQIAFIGRGDKTITDIYVRKFCWKKVIPSRFYDIYIIVFLVECADEYMVQLYLIGLFSCWSRCLETKDVDVDYVCGGDRDVIGPLFMEQPCDHLFYPRLGRFLTGWICFSFRLALAHDYICIVFVPIFTVKGFHAYDS